MLILERKADESVLTGDEIVIKVLDVRRFSVRIGVDAPADIDVLRGELEPHNRQEESASETSTAKVKVKSDDQKVAITYRHRKKPLPQ